MRFTSHLQPKLAARASGPGVNAGDGVIDGENGVLVDVVGAPGSPQVIPSE